MTSNEDSRMQVLRMIEEGQITADEGLRLLNAMGKPESRSTRRAGEPGAPPEAAEAAPRSEAGPTSQAESAPDPQIQYWRRWWLIPLSAGVAAIVLGSVMLYGAMQTTGFWFWSLFTCAWVPFLAGVGLTALAWSTRQARWVHIRADTGDASRERRRRISISLPLPVGLIAWLVRTFGHSIAPLKRTAVDELIMAIGESATPDTPIFIDVDEGEKGERVQVYIG